VPDVQTFRKLYLPHPDSDLDVLYMNLDLLDESYPMMKSKLPSEDFDLGGLRGAWQRLTTVSVRPSRAPCHGRRTCLGLFAVRYGPTHGTGRSLPCAWGATHDREVCTVRLSEPCGVA
jgi:hypothetical protein